MGPSRIARETVMLSEFYKTEKIPLTTAFGTEYPEYFLRPAAEYHALVRSCGVIDLTHWHVLRVRGRDRAGFLDSMVTHDVASLPPGQGCHSSITTVEGKIISELFVFALETRHLVVVSQGDFLQTVSALRTHGVGGDVIIDDISDEYGILGVEGPEAKTVLHRLLGTGPLPTSDFGVVEREFEGFTVVVVRGSASGDPGYHVAVPAAEVLRIRDYLVQAARGSDGLPVGYTAWNIRRVENGIAWYGIDFSGDNFPQEARLGRTVGDGKGRFRGQEALSRFHVQGHGKSGLVGLVAESEAGPYAGDVAADFEFPGRALPDRIASRPSDAELSAEAVREAEALDCRNRFPTGSPLHRDELEGEVLDRSNPTPDGWITSVVFSLALRKSLFMGRVRPASLETNCRFLLDTREGPLRLRVVELPLKSA